MHRPVPLLAFCSSLRKAVRGTAMDYLIAGLATIALFVYLMYALLKPERF
jgi:K+-transporting ATPase KdpF subunit